MHDELTLSDVQKEWHGTLAGYVFGFFASLILTGLSFGLVALKWFDGVGLYFIVISLGIIQAAAQIVFFLHVGSEAKPKWETMIFCFMVLVLTIVVIGTLWIMYDLNDRVMPAMEIIGGL